MVEMTSRIPILCLGILLTGAALAQVAGWIGLGSLFLAHEGDDQTLLIVSLLIGSAVTGCLYALLAAWGQVRLSIWLGIGITLLAVVARRRWVVRAGKAVAALYGSLWQGRRWLLVVSLVVLMVYWIVAVAPPRDADVMRYHLAHIRQIITDGSWQPIPDYHYALPFGWSLNYLPFEYFGAAPGAHFLNLCLWIVAVGILFDRAKAHGNSQIGTALCAIFAFQPMVLKSATTAASDMYLIFVSLVVTVLLIRLPARAIAPYGALGFAAWIGLQSRYQAFAVGLAVTLILLLFRARLGLTRKTALAFAGGSAGAILLSLPFYLANWIWFRNPLWPLMVSVFDRFPGYADRVADATSASLRGHLDPVTLFSGVWQALTSLVMLPVPIMCFLLLLASLHWRSRVTTILSAFIATFLLIWALAQPKLNPRFFLYLFPPVLVGWAPILSAWMRSRILKQVALAGTSLLVVGLAGVCAYYSYDSLAYAVTGDLRKYHEFTWFYDVYKWANQSTPPDARFLVIVQSGQSYYLDRPYRRADPCFSGVVDWPATQDTDAFLDLLRAAQYRYVIYENTDWSGCPGGSEVNRLIEDALHEGSLTKVAAFDVDLGISRFLRRTHPATVWVLSRTPQGRDLPNNPTGPRPMSLWQSAILTALPAGPAYFAMWVLIPRHVEMEPDRPASRQPIPFIRCAAPKDDLARHDPISRQLSP